MPYGTRLIAAHDSSPPDLPALVDRVEELAWLEHRLRDAVTGRPRVLLLLGEAGIGKSRLLRELARVARNSGAAVCIGRAYEDLALPYLPFVEALRARVEQLPDAERQLQEGLLGPDATALSQLFGTRPAADPPQALSDEHARLAGADRLAMYAGIARALEKLARARPTVLVLEDLHWADASSLDLLAHLVFRLADRDAHERVPLLIVCASRPPQPGDRAGRLFARFAREPLCESRELTGLPEPDAMRLIEELSPDRLSRGQLQAVLKTTAGNPLFLQEAVLALQRIAATAQPGTQPAPHEELVLPESITNAVSARIDTLDDRCVQALTHAALLGERFGLPELASVLDERPEALVDVLEPALTARLLRADGAALVFRHPLIRHVCHHRPSSLRRQLMHLRISRVLQGAPQAAQNAARIAQHLLAAGLHADPVELAAHARQAAEQSVQSHAWAEAARYFAAAAGALQRACPDDHEQIGLLHLRAGIAYRNDADRINSLEQLDRAIDRYETAGDAVEVARAVHFRTRASFAQITYGTEVDPAPLQKAAARVEQRDPALAALLQEALCELYWLARKLDLAEPLGEASLLTGRRLEDDLLRHHAALGLGLVRFQQLRLTDALECYRESRDAAARLHDAWLENAAMQRMPAVLQLAGRLDEAEQSAREALSLSTELHNAAEASIALSHLSNLALARGQLAEAESFAHSTLTMVQRSEYPWGGVTALPALSYVRCLTGAFSDARDALSLLDTPGRLWATPGPQLELLGAIYRDLVEVLAGVAPSSALRERVAFYAAVGTTQPIEAGTIAPLCAVVEQALALGDTAVVRSVCESLAQAYARGAVLSIGWVYLVPRVLALGAAALGRDGDARRYFDEARTAGRAMGLRPERARTELDLARFLADRGERDAAIEHAWEAAREFGAMGAAPWERRARVLLRELGARDSVPASRPVPIPASLSRRETELLRRVARGQSDATIADELISSVTTIAADVQTLLAKIGAESRSAAVAYAYEQGLVARETVSGQVPLAILVTDLAGFTPMVERLGDATAQELIRAHNRVVRGCLRRHGGIEVTHTGDGVIASFTSIPCALRCALDMQRELATAGPPDAEAMHMRIGVSAGSPRIEEDRLFGTAIIAAVRICGRAHPGQILVSDAVRRGAPDDVALEPRGEVALKGFEQALALYSVLATSTPHSTGE